MTRKKNTDSQSNLPAPNLQRPEPLPDWVPQSSAGLQVDAVVAEIAAIGFDRTSTPAETRLKALDKLLKHKGGYIERIETSTVDSTQVEIARQMFAQMTPKERLEWLEYHKQKMEASVHVPLHPSSPPDPPSPPTPSTLDDLHGK